MARRYFVYDVFSTTRLAGNPLAVVLDSEDLSTETMQAIAAEFALSETAFVLPAANAAHAAHVRIFTPSRELPFAGHPTVGTAIALAEQRHDVPEGGLDVVSVLEEGVGPVRCAIRLRRGEASFAEFELPRRSERIDLTLDHKALADALSVSLGVFGFENHVPSVWSAGVPFLMIPLHNINAVASIEFDPILWERAAPFVNGAVASAYVYCRGGLHHAAKFHARMFSPDMGIAEDPATGSAAAALTATIQHFDALPSGHHALMIEQGVEMGRPSYINMHLEIEGGAISNARIGGSAVRIASGLLEI